MSILTAFIKYEECNNIYKQYSSFHITFCLHSFALTRVLFRRKKVVKCDTCVEVQSKITLVFKVLNIVLNIMKHNKD